MIYWILLLLYMLLTFVYALFTPNGSASLQPWMHLQSPAFPDLPASCQRSEECPPDHVCVGHVCVPQFLRGGTCQPETGYWMLYEHQGATFAVCSCIRPEIFNQRFFGGDCNVLEACNDHGFFDSSMQTCICDSGYESGPNYTCQKAKALDQPEFFLKHRHMVAVDKIRSEDGFHPDYVQKLKEENVKFVQKPCTFDVLTGQELEYGFFKPDWGCVCDPRRGLIGVTLEGRNKKYLSTRGYDGCAKLFENEAVRELEVELWKFYYLAHRPPIGFMRFSNLSESFILPDQVKTMTVGQKWAYDYMQYVLHHEKIAGRTRYCVWEGFGKRCFEKVTTYPLIKPACYMINKFFKTQFNDHSDAYDRMYRFPICFVEELFTPEKADAVFANKYIMNPNLLMYPKEPKLYRTNALAMHYREDFQYWYLNTEEGYNVSTYKNIDNNAPMDMMGSTARNLND